MYSILCIDQSDNPFYNYIFMYMFVIIFIDLIDFSYSYLTKELYLVNLIITLNLLYLVYIIFIVHNTLLKRLQFDLNVVFIIIFVVKLILLFLNYFTPIMYWFFCFVVIFVIVFLLMFTILSVKEVRKIILVIYHESSINSYFKLLFYITNIFFINLILSLTLLLSIKYIDFPYGKIYVTAYAYTIFIGLFIGMRFDGLTNKFKNDHYPGLNVKLDNKLSLRQNPPYSNNIILVKGQEKNIDNYLV